MYLAYMECILIFVVCLNDRNAVLKGPARDKTGNKQSLSPAIIRKFSRVPAVADIIVSVAVIDTFASLIPLAAQIPCLSSTDGVDV